MFHHNYNNVQTIIRSIFMQDGAPPHYANSARNLPNALPGGSISRYSTIEWALDHPILCPLIFLWGAMKDPVYNSKPHSLDDLKIAITTQFNAINLNN